MKPKQTESELAKAKQEDLDYMEEMAKFGRPLTGEEKRRLKRRNSNSKMTFSHRINKR